MHTHTKGFTIVELLIVVVVIAILAAITIISYNGISNRAKESALKSDVEGFAKAIENDKIVNNSYPSSASTANDGKGLTSGSGNTVSYNVDGSSTAFCLEVSRAGAQTYFATQANLNPIAGSCTGVAGIASTGGGAIIQNITNANCSTSRTRAVDARDGRTYWVQKLADGKCWMLTNLAYGGGGANVFSDTKALTNGTGSTINYTTANYYVPTNANVTNEPTTPSTSTDGGVTGTQYGYLYNWCGAMGGQATAACTNTTTPVVTSATVCPSGWRLPTGTGGSGGGEFGALNTAVNGGLFNTDAGLRSTWLLQRSGEWYNGFGAPSIIGEYWSTSASSAASSYSFYTESTSIFLDYTNNKRYGLAVRCVAI